MPKLDDISLTSDACDSPQQEELDEVNMARLLRVFDNAEADGNGVSVTVNPSPRLQSTLMR